MTSKLLDVRKAAARLLVNMLYQSRYSTRNLGWIYCHYAKYLFCVSFETFSSYLDYENEPLDDVEIPTYIVIGLWELIHVPRCADRLPDELRRMLSSMNYVKAHCDYAEDRKTMLWIPHREKLTQHAEKHEKILVTDNVR